MKISAESTDQLTTYNGAPVRCWRAVTDGGVEFLMFVAGVAVPLEADMEAFERELLDAPVPREVALHSLLAGPRGIDFPSRN